MILDEIVASKEKELGRLKKRSGELEDRAAAAGEARDFVGSLRDEAGVSVIAEFKRKSPSSGTLGGAVEPAAVAADYERGGAAALSILTDGPYFGGSPDDLHEAREACRLPLLRKDFLIDPFQMVESRASGADAVLLIVRILSGERLGELLAAARELGLGALVEVHDEDELGRALDCGARVIGVNARDLSSFAVNLNLAEDLLARIPADRIAVAESGIRGRPDVERMAAAGADAVLVGGWLMNQDPESVRKLAGVERRGRKDPTGAAGWPGPEALAGAASGSESGDPAGEAEEIARGGGPTEDGEAVRGEEAGPDAGSLRAEGEKARE